MASHSLPIPLTQVRGRAQASSARKILPLRTASMVFVALFILLLWLQFGLSLQITTSERLILDRRLELERLQRDNAALRLQIAEAESPQILRERALARGYQQQKPLYLTLSPVNTVQDSRDDVEASTVPALTATARPVALIDHSLLQAILGAIDRMFEAAPLP